jgi:hypothetical protein
MVLSASPTFSGSLTVTGAQTNLKMGNNSGNYNFVALNGTFADGLKIGLAGGATADASVYLDSGYVSSTPGNVVFRLGGASTHTEIARFDTSGNLLVGVTTALPSAKVSSSGNISTSWGDFTIGTTYPGGGYQLGIHALTTPRELRLETVAADSAGIITFYPGAGTTEKARIGSDGSFLIGNTTNAGAGNLSVSGVVHRTKGNSGAIANNATFNITLPTSNGTFILTLNTNSNATQPAVYIVASDGSISTATQVINVGGFCSAIGVASGNIITAKNTSGGTATVYWALLQTLVNA